MNSKLSLEVRAFFFSHSFEFIFFLNYNDIYAIKFVSKDFVTKNSIARHVLQVGAAHFIDDTNESVLQK